MSFNTYDYGSTVVLKGTFTDVNGNPADPSSVTLRILDPLGNETVVNQSLMTHVSAGVFTYPQIALTAGTWFYRWEGTGQASAVMDAAFAITATPFTDAAA